MKSKGRRYEREIIELLRKKGLEILDVASNCGLYAEHNCDLLIEHNGELVRGEVKFRNGGAGFKRVYARHDAECADGAIVWTVGPDWDEYKSGTVGCYLKHLWDDWGYEPQHEVTHKLPDTVVGWLSGRDVLFCRMARREWLAIWR